MANYITYFEQGFKAEIAHVGGNYNYGVYDVRISKAGVVVYQNPMYRYQYTTFGATYSAVICYILCENGLVTYED